MPVNPIPDNYPRVTAYLIVEGADAAIDFYKSVLGAAERVRMGGPDGRVGHAELQFGDSVVMLADAYPEMDSRDPIAIGGTPVSMTSTRRLLRRSTPAPVSCSRWRTSSTAIVPDNSRTRLDIDGP
jgi:hypothetical protein